MKRTEIERLLPGVFQRTVQEGTPIFALLEVMEALQARDEAVIENLDAYFDVYRTTDAFVPFLAGWVDLDWLFPVASQLLASPASLPGGPGRLRELVAAATFLAQWRGTARGLLRFLETATGTQGFAIEEQVPGPDGMPRPFHIRVCVPAEAGSYQALIERIIASEKPAYVTYELQVADDGETSNQPRS